MNRAVKMPRSELRLEARHFATIAASFAKSWAKAETRLDEAAPFQFRGHAPNTKLR